MIICHLGLLNNINLISIFFRKNCHHSLDFSDTFMMWWMAGRSGGSRISQNCRQLPGGVPTHLHTFSQKLHENERIRTERGHASLEPPWPATRIGNVLPFVWVKYVKVYPIQPTSRFGIWTRLMTFP